LTKKLFVAKTKDTTQPDCETCSLCSVVRSPKMRVIGEGKLGVLILGAFPSSEEDNAGTLGKGRQYLFLEKSLEDVGINMETDVWYTTVLGCRTPRNRKPTKKEVEYCRPRLDKIIAKLNPRVIILLGEAPFNALISPRITGRLTSTPFNKFFGDMIPDQEVARWLCPTWDIAELLAKKKYDDGGESKEMYLRDEAMYNMWKGHMADACAITDDVEIVNYASMCKITEDVDVAVEWVEEAMGWKYVAWDIEATGIKPHREGHKIVCVSLSNGEVSYSFPFFDDPLFRKMFKRLMRSSNGKIAHNLQYEATWTKVLLGYWVNNWVHDTMLGEHIINNTKPTGLKYCTYVSFGVIGYDASCDPFIKSNPEEEAIYGCNAFNRMAEAPMNELLLYNALDSLFTYKLFQEQRHRLDTHTRKGNALLTETAVTLAKITENGFHVKTENFKAAQDMLSNLMTKKAEEILAFEEVKAWDKEEPFSFTSTTQLAHLVFEALKWKPVAYTATGKPQLDKEAIDKMNKPFLNVIVEYREIAKMQSTYISGWERENVDGIVHSQFLLNTVDTYRSASSSPNSQNSYKRDKTKKKIVRSIIAPRRGNRIVEFDFSGLETYINMFYSNDPTYKYYLQEPNADMHRDVCKRIFLLDDSEVTKEYRSTAKGATFAWTYGSYYVLIAKDMWYYITTTPTLLAHMESKGIHNLAEYEVIMKRAEDYFWNELFVVHNAWRKKQWKEYQKVGHLDTYTGFRLQAVMSRNNTFNAPCQGSGAHCLFWVLNRMQDKVEELGLKSMMIGEIHDSSIWDIDPAEEAIIDKWMHYYSTKGLQEEYSWISIPLHMDKERSAIDGTWAEMEDCGSLGALVNEVL